jgi:hypothetical protein
VLPLDEAPSLLPDLNSDLNLLTDPNQRIHMDVLGPLCVTKTRIQFVLSITIAHSWYVQLVGLPDVTTATIADAVFNQWICLFGAHLQDMTSTSATFHYQRLLPCKT